jgi:type III secretion system YscD/HrpQ family protein
MNAVSAITTEDTARDGARLVMRVLTGRNEGAQHVLPPDRRVLIGHAYDNDIVLRNAQSRGLALQLTPHGKLAVLEVLAGEIMVLGRSLVAGERVTLEPYVPVRTCGIAFAIGEADEARWAAAGELAVHDPEAAIIRSEAIPRTNLSERIELRTQPLRSRYADTLFAPRNLALAAALLLAVAVGTFVGTSMLAPPGLSPQAVKRELVAQGFGHLGVEQASNGEGLAIVGLVADETQLLRLRQWAEATHPDMALGVATLTSAAEAARNLLAAQNVDAEVRPSGLDGLMIETEFLPRDRQAELEGLLRRDLPRVQFFTFTTSAQRGESDLAYFFNAPGYGAASFVAGDPGYIVTEDGTRWFAGANLPTGHTILDITGNSVTVERDGQRDTLVISTLPTNQEPDAAKEPVQ